MLKWQDDETRTIFDWAQDNFGHIKADCGLDDWSVQIAPQTNKPHNNKHMEFAQHWNMAGKEPYYVDGYGRPVIYYDPRQCEVPGYFAARVILKLAEIKLMNFNPERTVTPVESRILTLATACYMRQGFTLAAIPETVQEYFSSEDGSPPVNRRIINNSLAFSTCMILLSRKLATEQIIATYGTLMTPRFRKKIRPACKQLETHESEIKLMKLLANPPQDSFDNRSYSASA
ncbi:hypothetical protein N9W89_02570 [Hellea sp.]|nr:hypothetical protein [Hellea sp.]